MNKKVKLGLIVVVGVLLAGAAGYVTASRSLNALVRSGIEQAGTEAADAPVTLDRASLSPFSGKGELAGLTIDNPAGFTSDHAFALGRIYVQLDVRSLRSGLIVIHEIRVDGAQLTAEQQPIARNNLLLLLKNIQAFTGPSEEASWPNVVVERFVFTNGEVRVRLPLVAEKRVAIPDVEVTGIGRPSVGVSVPEMLPRILEPVITEALKAAGRGSLPF